MKLSDRVDALTGPDRGMDAEIAALTRSYVKQGVEWAIKFPNWEADFSRKGRVNLIGNVNGNGNYIAGHFTSEPYTISLDAALTLFETIPDTIPSCPRKCVAMALRMKGL